MRGADRLFLLPYTRQRFFAEKAVKGGPGKERKKLSALFWRNPLRLEII